MKRLILVVLCLLAFPAMASHIVGGELEMLHLPNGSDGIEKYRYRLNLIYYFDVKNNNFTDSNGNPIAPEILEPSLLCTFYRKSDEKRMSQVTLNFLSKSRELYTQAVCSIAGIIITDKLIYTQDITLPPGDYSDPQGYYVIWERCCRNYAIVNIFSDDPGNSKGIPAGQTFYLSFPPVNKNGKPFINSSPHLFPPLSDYACPNKPYYANFNGIDDDGDSIAYSLTTPFSTHGSNSYPPMLPEPYPLITWRPTYSIKNIMGGHPDLKISQTGFLTVTPGSIAGLFVFAVRCEEYRSGQKIGETRRDFQLYVSEFCPQDDPPQILGKKLADATFGYDHTMDVTFSNTIDDTDRCIQVQVSDDDSDPSRDGQENITIKAIALNFKKDISSILPSVTKATLINNSTANFEICFDKCPFLENTPYQIGIVAYDDACAVPLTDTLKINVTVQPPPNNPPQFITPDVSDTWSEGDPKKVWPVQAVDVDGDAMNLFLVAKPPFDLAGAGMSLDIIGQTNDTLKATFSWNPTCTTYDFSHRTDFMVDVLVGSHDQCNFIHYDTMVFDLKLILRNPLPVFSINSLDLKNPLINNALSITLGQQVSLDLSGKETNTLLPQDQITIEMISAKGNVAPTGYAFTPVEGASSADTKFLWKPDCSIFQNQVYENNYTFAFRFTDQHCIVPLADTMVIDLTVKDVDGSDKDFNPRNFFTPNGDDYNQYFAMEDIDEATDKIIALPKDNCVNKFESIRIYNRWGKAVFESAQRNFRWYADDAVVGVYFYYLKYTTKVYKGTVTVRR